MENSSKPAKSKQVRSRLTADRTCKNPSVEDGKAAIRGPLPRRRAAAESHHQKAERFVAASRAEVARRPDRPPAPHGIAPLALKRTARSRPSDGKVWCFTDSSFHGCRVSAENPERGSRRRRFQIEGGPLAPRIQAGACRASGQSRLVRLVRTRTRRSVRERTLLTGAAQDFPRLLRAVTRMYRPTSSAGSAAVSPSNSAAH